VVRPEILKEFNFNEEESTRLLSEKEGEFLALRLQKLEKRKLEQSDKKKANDETMERYLKQQAA
jgi:hypothetical protein